MNIKRAQQGFTLIELVIVIVILGLLAATALPRFIDITDEARDAALAGVFGGFGSAIAITHAQWLATGESTTIQLQDGSNIPMNGSGWPDTNVSGDEAAAKGVYGDIMSQAFDSLGSDWTASFTGGKSRYMLGVIGDGRYFEYDENDGSVTCTGC